MEITLGIELEKLRAIVDPVHEKLGRYRVKFILSPELIMEAESKYPICPLNWKHIKYDDDSATTQIPNDKRGIYAFVVMHDNAVLPSHGYVMYIGIAGRKKFRSLQARYKDYLQQSNVRKRRHIARMIVDWYDVLQFFFAPIEIGNGVTIKNLKDMEKELNSALLPPFSRRDMYANLRAMRDAF